MPFGSFNRIFSGRPAASCVENTQPRDDDETPDDAGEEAGS